MDGLSRAIAIASEAHAGQLDKGGQPYILHPLRVMMQMRSDNEKIAAVLHDVAEDCPSWPLSRLRQEAFSYGVLAALDNLTRRHGEAYDDFIDRCSTHTISAWVKLADLMDNLNLTRIPEPSEADIERRNKYLRAITRLKLPV
jgi:(p)ppGpp synthase/HD superfamily hydrolase